MLRASAICLTALVLQGCGLSPTYQAQQHEKWVAEVERQDDEACRAQQSTPYETCRKLRMQYHAQAMQGGGVDMATPMQNAGAYLQNINPTPAPRPVTNCISTPGAGGVRTTCQ